MRVPLGLLACLSQHARHTAQALTATATWPDHSPATTPSPIAQSPNPTHPHPNSEPTAQTSLHHPPVFLGEGTALADLIACQAYCRKASTSTAWCTHALVLLMHMQLNH
jgi:hypothetical protein